MEKVNERKSSMRQTNSSSSRLLLFCGIVSLILSFAMPSSSQTSTRNFRNARDRWLRLHAFPNSRVDWKGYQSALDASLPHGKLGASSIAPQALANQWQFVGPTNLVPPYRTFFGIGPVNGRVNAVTFDPVNPRTFYIGSPGGGVWKTTNAGVNWIPLLDTQTNLSVSSVVVDPNNANVIYVGTGDYDGGELPGFGLLKSTDAGLTWINLDPTHSNFGVYAIRKILIDPSVIDPISKQSKNIIVTGGQFGDGGRLFRSTNSGGSWNTVLSVPSALFVSAAIGDVVYNADRTALYASSDQVGVYKSTNNGANWIGPLAGAASTGDRIDVAASQVDPKTIYVLDGGASQIRKSTDGGVNWRNVTGGPLLNPNFWRQTFYDFYIACAKRTVPSGKTNISTDAVYVGLIGVYQSPDGGATWFDASQNDSGADLAHTDQHAIAFNPANPNDILTGNDGGVFRMTYSPLAAAPYSFSYRFTSLNKLLGISQFYGAAANPVDSSQLLGGTQDNSTPHADGDLANWLNPGAGDGFASAINSADPFNRIIALRSVQNQYLTSQFNNIYVTENNWATKLAIPIPAVSSPEFDLFFTPLVLHNNNQLFAYSGTQFLYQYTHPPLTDDPTKPNTNVSWTKFGQDFRGASTDPGYDIFDSVNAIGSDPNNILDLYVGTTDGKFWISKDQGATFIRADGGGRFGLPGRPITSITVSPSLPTLGGKVWVTLAGAGGVKRVWFSNNANETVIINGTVFSVAQWRPVGGVGLPDIPTNTLVLLPHQDEQAMFIGNDVGVYFSGDGGANWSDTGMTLGLPRAVVNQLVFAPATGMLQAFTFGRGVWRILAGNDVPINIYPNLQGYRGDRSKLVATVEFTRPNSLTVIETRQLNLTQSGFISTNISFQGACDIYIKIRGFLYKRIRNASTNNGFILTPLMLAGDVNIVLDRNNKPIGYGDNTIDDRDVLAVQKHMGQAWNGPEDVDGDGRVTVNDLNLVVANLGRNGDP